MLDLPHDLCAMRRACPCVLFRHCPSRLQFGAYVTDEHGPVRLEIPEFAVPRIFDPNPTMASRLWFAKSWPWGGTAPAQGSDAAAAARPAPGRLQSTVSPGSARLAGGRVLRSS